MAGDETPKEKADKEIADCVKRKATAQASFTRIYNNLAKLIQDKDVPIQALHQTLADLTEKFKLLETKVDELIMKLPDSDDMCQELSDLLSSKYDLLTDLRSTIMRIDEKYTADVAAKELSSNENTAELIRSFKASLTLPRPEIKKFNGNAAD
jgi:chromosome segregation ATPase